MSAFLARAVAVLAIVSAAVGVWQHIDANLDPHADHAHHHDAADDADAEAPASDDHAADADEEATERADDHAAEEDPDAAVPADAEEATAAGPSLGDVLAGSAGHAPVPAALAIAPVGLALGLATIGLGGRRRSQG